MRWLTIFYDFSFKWTFTAAIGIHPTKSDCHSWWISKMPSGRQDTLDERYAIKFYFKPGKNDARETYGMLQTAFRPSCMNQESVFEWHKRFKEARESMRGVGGVRSMVSGSMWRQLLMLNWIVIVTWQYIELCANESISMSNIWNHFTVRKID